MRKNIVSCLLLGMVIFLVACQQDQTQQSDESISGRELSLTNLGDTLRAKTSFPQKQNGNAAPMFGAPTTRNDLGSMRTVVKILNGKDNAGLTVPGFGGIQLGKDESSLSAYYVETSPVGDSVYGIGYSVHYLFRKLKRGISLTNLAQVAASVQLESNRTQVIYSMQSYGIRSLSLVNYFKPTVNKDFDVEGFGIMQSSIDGIHNVLSDSALSAKTSFQPVLLPFLKPADLVK